MNKFLTLERLTVYAVATLILGCSVIIAAFVEKPARLSGATDFPAFYNAGRIARQDPARLYDPALQMELFADVAPLMDAQEAPLFTYTPFFSLIFVPLSVLPYLAAFAAWFVLCLVSFLSGLRLVWRTTDLPSEYLKPAAVISISFLPFFAWCLFMGQTTVFGFVSLALAIYLERTNKSVLSGIALSLLLYKPPLLALVVPMLLITKRWRAFAGFTVGGSILAVISLALIGPHAIRSYVSMLRSFAEKKVGLAKLTHLEVDSYSFFVNLTNGQTKLAMALWATLFAVVGYWLIKAWRLNPQHAWITAIIWTCVLNYYVLLYDATLIVLSAVLLIGVKGKVSTPLRWLLTVVFLTPWFNNQASHAWGFQPMTMMLIVLGCYELYVLTHSTVHRSSVVCAGIRSEFGTAAL